MPNPSPIYLVKYNDTVLKGYATSEDIPLAMRIGTVPVIGSDGGVATGRGGDFRNFQVGMRILSRLSSGSGLAHITDCKDQWRDNLATCARVSGPAKLYIGESDRYILCTFESSSAPLVAGSSKAISFELNFQASTPWFLGTTVSGSQGVGGNTTVSVTIGNTRKTYPVIIVPSGITHIMLDHTASGKSLILSGSHLNPLVVDCSTLSITSGGNNAYYYLSSSPNFGMYQSGAGTMVLNASQVVGSGTVTVSLTPRYER